MKHRSEIVAAAIAPLLRVSNRPRIMKAATRPLQMSEPIKQDFVLYFFSRSMKIAKAAKLAKIRKEPAEFDVVKNPLTSFECSRCSSIKWSNVSFSISSSLSIESGLASYRSIIPGFSRSNC